VAPLFLCSVFLSKIKGKTDGSRPVKRHTFFNAKKVCKKACSCGGHFFRLWSVLCSAAKVDEYVCAAWQRKPGPAFLNPLNERAVVFGMTDHENIPCSLFGFQASCPSLQQPC
jgi:hypothetical protein